MDAIVGRARRWPSKSSVRDTCVFEYANTWSALALEVMKLAWVTWMLETLAEHHIGFT